MNVPLAHAGHWLESVLFLAPVVVLVVILTVQGRREPSKAPDGEADEDRD
jgi:hypothetical protein